MIATHALAVNNPTATITYCSTTSTIVSGGIRFICSWRLQPEHPSPWRDRGKGPKGRSQRHVCGFDERGSWEQTTRLLKAAQRLERTMLGSDLEPRLDTIETSPRTE